MQHFKTDEETRKNIGLGSNSNDAHFSTTATWLLNYSAMNVAEISALYESKQFAIFQPADKTTTLPFPAPPPFPSYDSSLQRHSSKMFVYIRNPSAEVKR